MTLSAALADAATHAADALLVWLPAARPDDGSVKAPYNAASPADTIAAVRTLIAEMEATGLRDLCLVALCGPGASRALARKLSCDGGFGPDLSPAHIVAALAHEVAAHVAFQRRGQSPPCYL